MSQSRMSQILYLENGIDNSKKLNFIQKIFFFKSILLVTSSNSLSH